MTQKDVSNFPPIDAAYTDEFGVIDPQVYEAAKEIWNSAARLAAASIHDHDEIARLMFKTIANISKHRRSSSSEIHNLRAFLYRSFKNLLLAELEREKNRSRIRNEQYGQQKIVADKEEK